MPLYHIIILAIIQGISEFLPVSSSGHLILTHALLQHGQENIDYWGDNLTIDIAVHVGTLLAVILYFRKDIMQMACGGIDILRTRKVATPGGKMLLLLIAASIPVVIAGLILHVLEPSWARSLQVAAWSLIIFGILLGIADKRGATDKPLEKITLKDAMLIGLAQMLALIPGTSRSGITMTAARFLGFSRVDAARFSFFLAIIAISGAGAIGALKILENPEPGMLIDIAVGITISCLAALGAVHFLMRWLQTASFQIFVWYRVALGALLLALIHAGILG